MATIKDIAERVGVSTCTVSRYINRKIVVKEETARKIDEAIRDLDYHKNYMAVSLKTRSSRIIALVIPSLKNIFFAEIADNIATVLEQHGYSMITFTTDNDIDKEKNTCDKMLEMGVAGAIFMTLPFAYRDGEHIERLRTHKIAVLMVNRFFSPGEFPAIATDFRAGVRQGTELLLARGSRRPGLIVGAEDHPQSDVYREAFIETLQEAGLDQGSAHVKYCYFNARQMERVTDELLDEGVDAIFGISDFTSLSSLSRIRARGLEMPRDIMLIGSGNTQFSELVDITSLDSRTDLLGLEGAKMMLSMLRGRTVEPFVSVPPDIVERGSTP